MTLILSGRGLPFPRSKSVLTSNSSYWGLVLKFRRLPGGFYQSVESKGFLLQLNGTFPICVGNVGIEGPNPH